MTAELMSFPYPLLGNSDDISGEFEWDASIKLAKAEVTISAQLRLGNKDLDDLISAGKARFVLQVQCPLTFFRELFISDNSRIDIKIPSGALRESVEMAPFIVSAMSLPSYAPKTAHKDYEGASFRVAESGILAVAPKAYFVADKEFVGSKRRLRSIMEFVRHTREGAEPEFRFGSDRIEIFLNSTDWDAYQQAKKSPDARNLIHAAVVFPVLLEALECLDDDNYIGVPWRERLKVLLREKGLEDAKRFQQATGLLKNPISRAFSGLSGLLNQDGMSDDEDD